MNISKYISNNELFHFIKKYAHLFYIGISSWILTPYGILSWRWWFVLCIMFLSIDMVSLPAWRKYIKKYETIDGGLELLNGEWWKRYIFVFTLGAVFSLYDLHFVNLNLWLINIPTIMIIIYHNHIYLLKCLSEKYKEPPKWKNIKY